MPGKRLYLSHSFTALRNHAFAWLNDHADETPESARFLETNSHQQAAIKDAWADQYTPLRLSVSGFDEFARTLHERLYTPYLGVETLQRRRTIEQALIEGSEDLLEHPRHHTSSLSDLFNELEAHGVNDVATLRDQLDTTACTDAQRTVLVDAYKHYLEIRPILTHAEAIPRSEKFAAVADADESLTEVCPHLDAVVLSGFVDPSPVELDVLDRLSEEFPVLVLMPTPDPTAPTAGIGSALEETLQSLTDLGFEQEALDEEGSAPLRDTATRLYEPVAEPDTVPPELSWHEAPTPDREVRHVARRLRQRLAADACDPEDLLVLAPGLLSYRDGIADVFEAYGIDHAYSVSVLLERTYVGRAILDAVDLCEQPRADRLAELVTNPIVDLPGVDADELVDVQRRLYSSAIDAFTSELEASAAGVDELLTRVEAVRDATAEECVPAVRALLDHIGLPADMDGPDAAVSVNAGYEARARARVEAILDSVATVCAERDPEDPLTEVATAVEGVRVPPPQQVTEDRVEIIGLQDATMADFNELIVLGATSGHLSGNEPLPRFFQAIGEELDVLDRHRQRDIDRYRFGTLLANADRVHITTPDTTVDDEPFLVSPFVDELARVTGLEPTTGTAGEQRGAREDLQRAVAGASPADVEAALSDACDAGHVTDGFVTAAGRGAACGANRGVSDLSEHDAQLTTDGIDALGDKLTSTPYSHTRLSRYAKCGFKYLLENGWGLDEDDDIEPGMDALTFGQFIHDAVERFYRELQPADGDPVDLIEYDRGVLERELLDAGHAALEAVDTPADDVFVDKTYYAIFSGLATPDVNEYYDPPWNSGNGDAAGTLAQFLESELDLADDGHRPVYFEADIGDGGGVSLPNGGTAPVGGIVDRVDLTPDGITVFDYKSSSVSGARSRENNARDGLDFQLPIYALGTPGLLDANGDVSPGDVDARYYVINDGPEVKLRRSLAERFDDIDYAAFMHDVVPDRLREVVAGVENGAFQPAVVGERTAKCNYCEFSDVCDVRHHRRYDVIEHIDETDHDAYVPAGVGPGDVTAALPGSDGDE